MKLVCVSLGLIEDLSFEHFDDEDIEFEAKIYNGENIELYHSDDDVDDDSDYEDDYDDDDSDDSYEDEADEAGEEDEEMNDDYNIQDVIETMNDEQYDAFINVVDMALAHSDIDDIDEDEDETIMDIIDTMNDKQKEAFVYVVDQALATSEAEEADDYDDYDDDDDEEYEEDSDMMQHAYDNNDYNGEALMHDALNTVIEDGKRFGSLRESYNFHMEEGALAHAIDTTGMDLPTLTNQQWGTQYGYGVNAPEMLYPEAKSLNTPPEFIKRDTEWAQVVWDNVHRTPFSRIKSVFANITEDEARAKGYLKGNMKKEEYFSLMKRVTVPQTVYKKQKLDRDDIIDITDYDIVRWIRSEMRIMWDEEVARAFLIGDGRPDSGDNDKISEEHIRPIASDKPLFSIQKTVDVGATDEATAKNFMKAAVRARKDYKGSGNPMLFTTEDVLTSMLLIEDGIGHRIYKSEAELATAIRVTRIVTVPVMEGHKLANGNELMGIIVNLKDYNVGTDKGGEVNLFDDFDIDYNQYKYLIESRCSGALIKPYSAIVLSKPVAAATPGDSG